MKVLVKKTILYYSQLYKNASTSLLIWHQEFSKHEFSNFNELKSVYKSASIVNNKRVVFNIKGNDFRLVVSINFLQNTCYVIWFGTHKEYDKINVETISFDVKILKKNKLKMNWKILKSEEDYILASQRLMELFEAENNTEEEDELALLVLLISDYDSKNYVFEEIDVLDVIKSKMEEQGLKAKDLEPIIGSKGHVSAVLSGKREITLKMAKKLKEFFSIPADLFLQHG